jgi:hypothetical protein
LESPTVNKPYTLLIPCTPQSTSQNASLHDGLSLPTNAPSWTGTAKGTGETPISLAAYAMLTHLAKMQQAMGYQQKMAEAGKLIWAERK